MAKPYFNLVPSQTQLKIDITSECVQALSLEPKERTESDVKLIMELIGNFPQINQAPLLIRHEVCKLGTYIKLEEDSVLYKSGDIAEYIYIILKGLIKEKPDKDSHGNYEESVTIGDGTIIGEEMILSEKIHTATAIAAADTDLMRLSIESYAHMRRIHEQDVSEKLSLLTCLPIFKSYDSLELTPLCDSLILKHYIPNKVIVEQGAEPTGMYFIKSGKCKMVKEMDVKLMPPPKTTAQMPPPPNKKTPQKKPTTIQPVSLPSSSPLSTPTSSTKPVPSSSSSSIGPHSTIHPFLASRLDPNYSKKNNNSNNNNNNNNNNSLSTSTTTTTTTTTSSSSPSSPSSHSSSSSPPTKSKLSPSTTRKPSSPSKSLSSTPPSTEKPETEKKFLEVGPVMPYEYFGERAIIENRSGVEISVLSETHVDLYYLPKIDFHRYINSKTISFMKKNAAGYPTDKEILAQYYKQQEWERYKTNLVQDILNEKANRNMGSMFSRTR